MAEKDSDLQKIEKLIEIMKRNGLVEVEIKHGDDKIFLKRGQAQQPSNQLSTADLQMPAEPLPATGGGKINKQQSAIEEDLVEIKSPIVGTFYATPSPDSEPCVELGSRVSPETVVCIVEAMKVMNEIKAETNGTVSEILVTNGQAVEYGQVLFRVKAD